MVDAKNLVACFRTLFTIDVLPDSRVMQSILQALKEKVNELELKDTLFLN